MFFIDKRRNYYDFVSFYITSLHIPTEMGKPLTGSFTTRLQKINFDLKSELWQRVSSKCKNTKELLESLAQVKLWNKFLALSKQYVERNPMSNWLQRQHLTLLGCDFLRVLMFGGMYMLHGDKLIGCKKFSNKFHQSPLWIENIERMKSKYGLEIL